MRGNNRAAVFHDPKDRAAYLDLFAAEIRRRSFLLHHYALMENHVHAILRLGPGMTLSEPMQRVQRAYSRYHARRYGRVGHLWEARFKSFFIGNDPYLLTCGIYVGLNPVRAGIVTDPNAYAWSSHHAYEKGTHDPLITLDPAYLGLADDADGRRAIYSALVLMWQERPVAKDKAKRFFARGPTEPYPG